MDDNLLWSPPQGDFDHINPLRTDAVTWTSSTLQGKACRLIDNTGDNLPEQECRAILQSLVENGLFGFHSLSAQGGDTINLERRESSHIQVGEKLYRLIVYRYEARIECF